MNAINVLSERSRLQQNETIHWPTGDTYVNQHTALCARLSAGACVDVAVAVARGEAASGVAIVRPPGHHAESNTAMGFCFFNNAGIAARAAQVRAPLGMGLAASECRWRCRRRRAAAR